MPEASVNEQGNAELREDEIGAAGKVLAMQTEPQPEAMSDPQVFFDAVGDADKLQRNVRAMMDSCSRFIDFDEANGQHMIDVVPTSQYVVKPPAA